MGVDIEHGFQPEYVVIDGKEKVLAEIKKAAKNVDSGLPRARPRSRRRGDRLAHRRGDPRVEPATSSASSSTRSPRRRSARRIAQAARARHQASSTRSRRAASSTGSSATRSRRCSGRRCGAGLSAGRVQSVAVRLIVEREARDQGRSCRVEYWTVEARRRGARRRRRSRAQARQARRQEGRARQRGRGRARSSTSSRRAAFVVAEVERKERAQEPAARRSSPRKLQQEAAQQAALHRQEDDGAGAAPLRRRRARRRGPVGLITYMRTDSTRLVRRRGRRGARVHRASGTARSTCPTSRSSTRPRRARRTRTRRSARLAEVRPGDGARRLGGRQGRRPRRARDRGSAAALHADLEPLRRLPDDAGGLRPDRRSTSRAGRVGLRATGQVLKFAGYLGGLRRDAPKRRARQRGRDAARALPDGQRGRDAQAARDQARAALHPAAAALHRGVAGQGAGGEGHRPPVDLRGDPVDHPGPRLRREEGGALPSDGARHDGQRPAGRSASPTSSHVTFTAQMEEQLDQVEEGAADWVKLLDDFYAPFKIDLEKAKVVQMRDVKREEIPTDASLREVRQADGHQVGAQRPLPRLLRLPRVQATPRSSCATPTARIDDRADERDHRREVRDLRRADGGQARPLRRVPGLLALPRLQDHAARSRSA